MQVPLLPIWITDFLGASVMIVLSCLILRSARTFYRNDPGNALGVYLLWFAMAISAFSISRSAGHILRYVFYLTGNGALWSSVAPVSGAINSITFVVIASVTLFFPKMLRIIRRMEYDRHKIELTSTSLLNLNREMEGMVRDRTRIEMALEMAHQVRNPVTIIGGLLKRGASKGGRECSDFTEYIPKILEQAEKLETMVNDLNAMLAADPGQFTELDLNQIVENCVESARKEADARKIIINLKTASTALPFRGIRHILKMAIDHVLHNAIEACRPGDAIDISTGIGEAGVELVVEDSGPGIPPSVLEHIFEPFYRTEEGRTGIGLPYVKQIIEDHRGDIRLSSEPGKGTRVTIIFPKHITELK